MKVSLSLVILVSTFIYGSTSQEYPDEGQPDVDSSAANQNNDGDLSERWSEKGLGEDRGGEDTGGEGDKQQLIAVDYFKIDSEESDGRTILQHAGTGLDSLELKQFKGEIAAGDWTQLFGTNPHLRQPESYPDFGRRFVPQYPYTVIKELEDAQDNSLIPKLESPELVLAVAKESAMLAAATPDNPSDDLIHKNILRSGDYWNALWKEDVDPKPILRSKERNKMESVMAKLTPGTEIYNFVSKIQRLNPKLLYVINKNNKT